jgi:hypothetical protein
VLLYMATTKLVFWEVIKNKHQYYAQICTRPPNTFASFKMHDFFFFFFFFFFFLFKKKF